MLIADPVMSAETRGVSVAAVVVHEVSHAGQQWTGPTAAISLSHATRQSQFTKLLKRQNVPYIFILRKSTVLVLQCVTVIGYSLVSEDSESDMFFKALTVTVSVLM